MSQNIFWNKNKTKTKKVFLGVRISDFEFRSVLFFLGSNATKENQKQIKQNKDKKQKLVNSGNKQLL